MPKYLAQIALTDGRILAPALIETTERLEPDMIGKLVSIATFVTETPSTIAIDGLAVTLPIDLPSGLDHAALLTTLPPRHPDEPLSDYALRLIPLIPPGYPETIIILK